jgi:drug/metabolite transporter (DMT)-like permease
LQMSFWRWACAFLILLLICLPRIKEHYGQIKKEFKFLLILGLFGVTSYNCLIYSAMHYTTVINASIINSVMPVVTFLLAMLFLNEKPTSKQIIGIIISVIGALTIIFRGSPLLVLSLSLNPGDVLVLFALTFWSVYTVLIRWRKTRLPLLIFLLVTVGFGVVFHFPLIAVEYYFKGGFQLTREITFAFVYFAIFPSILAYLAWNKAVELLGPGRTVIFIYLLPVYGAILGKLFLNEEIVFYHLLGFVFIFTGMLMVTHKSFTTPAQ